MENQCSIQCARCVDSALGMFDILNKINISIDKKDEDWTRIGLFDMSTSLGALEMCGLKTKKTDEVASRILDATRDA